MKWIQKYRTFSEWMLMLVGTLLMAVAIQYLFDPVSLVIGGFSGLSIILKSLNPDLSLWLTTLILNIPLFLIAWKLKGWRHVKNSLIATILLSVWLYVLPVYSFNRSDMVLHSVYGGVLSGVGIGLVFMANSTTGGTDLLASVIQIFIPHYSIAQIMQVLDALIVLIGAWVFGYESALYAIIAIYLTAKISDQILEGMKFAKLLYIISDHTEEIAQGILVNLNRGVTGLNGVGMYTGKAKNVLMCVVTKKELVPMKEMIYDIDPNAFVILSDAREVLGEGFAEHE